MTTTAIESVPSDTVFEAPGPGQWMLDTTHHGRRPITRFMKNMAISGFETGFSRLTKRFGLPLETMRMRVVHGHVYARPAPVGEGDSPRGNPPGPIMWLVARLHPELRRRNKTAARAWKEELWRADVDAWFSGGREEILAINFRFQATDPSGVSNGELAEHIKDLAEHLEEQYIAAFETHGGDLIPVGDFLATCAAWGLAAEEVAPLLAGASPQTVETRDLLAPVASLLAESDAKPTTVEEIRDLSPAADQAISDWLNLHGWRLLTSDDIDAPTLHEQPELQARILSNLGRDRRTAPSPDASELRNRVPTADRERFNTLLADARYGLRQRDDNAGLRLNWPAGLARRALLEAGDRLISAGTLTDRRQAFCLEPHEVSVLLRGEEGPSSAEIAGRFATREGQITLRAPTQLGADEEPPPLHLFPEPIRRATAAVMTMIDAMEGTDTQKVLTGTGVGGATYVGRACVIASPDDDLSRLQAGDVLIAPFTSPSFNSVLTLVGAMAAQEGGVLSHTAIVAREFGIPAVVGVNGLLDEVQDGEMVEVDPVAGTVRRIG